MIMQHGLIEQLKQARKNKKLSQTQLAKDLGWPQSHLSKLESGKVDLHLSNFIEWARILEFDPMLIPREQLAVTKNVLGRKTSSQQPLYQLDDQESLEDFRDEF